MSEYEIEHWPHYFGKHAVKRNLSGYIKGILLLILITVVLFALYFFTRLFILRWFTMGFAFVIAISPLLFIVSYLQRNKKVPSYGVNKDGFVLNERGWNAAFFTWDEIKDVKVFDHPKFGKELHFEFVSFTKALNKEGQDKFQQAIRREYEIAKEPKKISAQLVKGDLTRFIEKLQTYYNEYKRKFPISSEEAFELASAYNKAYSLGYEISPLEFELVTDPEGLKGQFYSFSLKNFEGSAILVAMKNQKVEGIIVDGKVYYPHTIENNLNPEECKAIVKSDLGDRMEDYKILSTYFAFGGVYEHPHPCWVVRTKNLKAKMEGSTWTDYFIDAKTREIATKLTS